MDKHQYKYRGPVMEFGRCITNLWEGTTWAESQSKARSNLAYQFKKQNNRMPTAQIELPGYLYF